jgi:hypothetical protein
MQAEIDHAQGAGYFRHTIEMINAATKPDHGGAGAASWTRVNGSDIGNAINAVYALNDPSTYPVWVTGRLSDHPGLNITYDREMAALSAPPPSVGGIAESPDVTALPSTTSSSGRDYTFYIASAAVAILMLAAGGGWWLRRHRA